MKSWIKTFIVFLFFSLSFIIKVNSDVNAVPLYTKTLNLENIEQTVISEHQNTDCFLVTQNTINTKITGIKNNKNNLYSLDNNIVLNNIYSDIFCDYINFSFSNRISHNISPKIEYAINIRAP